MNREDQFRANSRGAWHKLAGLHMTICGRTVGADWERWPADEPVGDRFPGRRCQRCARPTTVTFIYGRRP